MDAVFLGGSRRIARLDAKLRSKLDELVDRGLWMFIGDANGADRAIQQYLADRRYDRVIIYAVRGMLRNNVGHWTVRFVDAPEKARGVDLYSIKDVQMAQDASYGLMLWDGKSRGTLANVHNLLVRGKPVAVHLQPAHRLISLKSRDDLRKLGVTPDADIRERQNSLFQESPNTSQRVAAPNAPEYARGPKRSRSTSVRSRK